MKIAAIIAEYNPFHEGHAYQIREIRDTYGYDRVIVLMSGDFVQRGSCALVDKYVRTRMALSCGADLVLELPTVFATGSAQYFAEGALSILCGLGCVDALFFGAEDVEPLLFSQVAQVLTEEPASYQTALADGLKNGLGYARARSAALQVVLHLTQAQLELLAKPNNILGIEYYAAAKRMSFAGELQMIQRTGDGYHGTCSAEGIRACIERRIAAGMRWEQFAEELKMPVPAKEILENAVREKRLSFFAEYAQVYVQALFREEEVLTSYLDCNVELANKMKHALRQLKPMTAMIDQIKSKEITYTRIARVFTHVLLGITAKEAKQAKEDVKARYARILGFKESAKAGLLRQLKQQSQIPLIAKPSEYHPEGTAAWIYEVDLRSADLYELLIAQRVGKTGKKDVTRSPLCIAD